MKNITLNIAGAILILLILLTAYDLTLNDHFFRGVAITPVVERTIGRNKQTGKPEVQKRRIELHRLEPTKNMPVLYMHDKNKAIGTITKIIKMKKAVLVEGIIRGGGLRNCRFLSIAYLKVGTGQHQTFDWYETSLVSVPADKHAKIFHAERMGILYKLREMVRKF